MLWLGSSNPGRPRNQKFFLYSFALCHWNTTIVQENLIAVEDPHPLQYVNPGKVTNFSNQTMSGALIRGYDATSGAGNPNYSELSTLIEDSMML